jgi:hypothetical protein
MLALLFPLAVYILIAWAMTWLASLARDKFEARKRVRDSKSDPIERRRIVEDIRTARATRGPSATRRRGTDVRPSQTSTESSSDRGSQVPESGQQLQATPQWPPRPPRPEVRFRAISHVDWKALIEARMRTGATGEEIVVMLERDFLRRMDRHDLASRVLHVAREHGDGSGYDIRSFFEDGREKFLEVKTTKATVNQPFFASSGELDFLDQHREDSFVYRVFLEEGETERVQIQVYSAQDVLMADKFATQYRIKMPDGRYRTLEETYATVACPTCGIVNRVPASRYAQAICGSCRADLFASDST